MWGHRHVNVVVWRGQQLDALKLELLVAASIQGWELGH